ncbi:MAG: hypothetical protein ACYDDV_03285 [Methanoregula sp.]
MYLFLKYSSEKKEPHILIPVDFLVLGWTKTHSKKCLNLKAFGGYRAMVFPPVFRQSQGISGVFFTGPKKETFAGFSGNNRDAGTGK